MSSNIPSFLFYDYETFGVDPARDRISQFAAIRTDYEFNIIGEPINIYCKQYEDYLPSPEAILITGITPEICNEKGAHEAEFTRQIHALFSTPNTCILGYNSIRFDDEMTRYLFYRNFYDPYAHHWQSNNSRWDLIDIVRATFALRPEGINWPMIDGLPSFRLEMLTKANNLAHEHAHDALNDVYATINMAKLIKDKQPQLFDYFFNHRHANALKPMIDTAELTPLVHVSGMFGAARGNCSLIVPISVHPWNKNAIICIDLMGDLEGLLTDNIEVLTAELYTATENLPVGKARVPIKLVHLNKCPILAPISTLKGVNELHGLDIDHALNNRAIIKTHIKEILPKAIGIFESRPDFADDPNVETKLYGGFFDNSDRAAINKLRFISPANLQNHGLSFQDARIAPLLFNYRAKNYPETLTNDEAQTWADYARQKRAINKEQYLALLDQLLDEHQESPEKIALLEQCRIYY